MSKLTQEGTNEPVSRDQILMRERGQAGGKNQVPKRNIIAYRPNDQNLTPKSENIVLQ